MEEFELEQKLVQDIDAAQFGVGYRLRVINDNRDHHLISTEPGAMGLESCLWWRR